MVKAFEKTHTEMFYGIHNKMRPEIFKRVLDINVPAFKAANTE